MLAVNSDPELSGWTTGTCPQKTPIASSEEYPDPCRPYGETADFRPTLPGPLYASASETHPAFAHGKRQIDGISEIRAQVLYRAGAQPRDNHDNSRVGTRARLQVSSLSGQ